MSEPESKKGIIVVIFIVIIIALAVGSYFLFFRGKPSPTTAPPAAEAAAEAAAAAAETTAPAAAAAAAGAGTPAAAAAAAAPTATSTITKSMLPVLKEFTQDDYSMGYNSTALEKRPSTDGPGAIAYSPSDQDPIPANKRTGQLNTTLDVTAGSVYQINMSVGDLTIFGSSNTPNKGPITIGSWNGTMVENDKTTPSVTQSITIQPGTAGNQMDLTYNLKIWQAGKFDFRVTSTDTTDKLAIKQCKVTLLT
jgi:hypothetical protein